MPKRLAITIAGAVSLGSYEAGVLFEVLDALSEHNTKAKSEEQKIYIDVITGASAGGMTAAIAAQCLLYNPDALAGDKSNVFYQAWVERISLWSLVKMKWKEPIWHSLLSSDLVELIGTQMLVDPIAKPGGTKLPKVHPAIEVQTDKDGNPIRDQDGNLIPKPLWLGMAVTNLNGLSYGYPILEGRSARFQYTRCVDQISREVAVSKANPVQLWTFLRDGAVASGAFPFAFRPKAIVRQRDEFDDPTLEWPKGMTHQTFAYTDGGVLQNQPIGLAKNLIDKQIQDRLSEGDLTAYNDADSRLYLFVSPHSLQSEVSVSFTAGRANFPRMTDELALTYGRQAEFHDWIMAENLNQQVNTLDQDARNLADAIKSGSVDSEALKVAAVQLATLLTGGTIARMEEVKRLEIQYAALYHEVTQIGVAAAEAWVNSILTLERAANLQTRDRMNILAVMAKGKKDLAGVGISSFVGFFSRKYREHDYLVGRIKAREYLAQPEVQEILGKIELKPATLPNPSTITNVPVPLLRALLVGSPALLWIAFWRVIRLLLSGVGVAVILVAALTFFLIHYWRSHL